MPSRYLISFILIFALGVSLRLININREFSGDEERMLIVKKPIGEVMNYILTKESHPPFTFMMLKVFSKISGSNWFLRMYFVFFGSLIIILSFFLAREFLDPLKSLLVMFFVSISPLLIALSQYARSYIDSAFFITASTVLFFKILNSSSPKKSVWVWYFITSILSLYTFYFTGLIILVQNICLFLKFKENRNKIRNWFFTQALLFATFLPWLFVMYKQVMVNATGRIPLWEFKGIQLIGIHVGILLRNIFALFGMDFYFLQKGPFGTLDKFMYPSLILVSIVGLGVIRVILTRLFKKDSIALNSLLLLAVLPLLFGLIMGEAISLFPNARYQGATHLIFIVFLVFLFGLLKNKKILVIVSLVLAFAYILRIPDLYGSEFNTKGAFWYIEKNKGPKSALIAFEDYETATDLTGIKKIEAQTYFSIDTKTGRSVLNNEPMLKKELQGAQEVFAVFRMGNNEIFGLNKFVSDCIKDNGYSLFEVKTFYRNVYVTIFKRKN